MNQPAACTMNTAALDALRQERVDWRFRSAAPALTGLTLGKPRTAGSTSSPAVSSRPSSCSTKPRSSTT